MGKFIIIDGNSLSNRAFYAMPYLSNRKKEPSGAVFGFANLLVKLITEQKPDYVAIAFDHARQTFRNQIYADYKGNRGETPADLLSQFPVIKNMLEIMGIKVFEYAGIEADDIIGTIASVSGQDNIVVSGDRDLLQLIDDKTRIWLTRKGVTDVEIFDEKALFEKWSVKPKGVIDLKALMGDSSDNIPGVAGIGEKTAMSLMLKYGSLDGVYQNLGEITGKLQEKLANGKDSAYMSQKLATIKTDCEIDFDLSDCKYNFPFSQEVRDFFEEWDFRSLLGRKDIFLEGVSSSKIEEKRIELKNNKDIEEFASSVKDFLSYDLGNLEFSSQTGVCAFVKKEIDLFSEGVDLNNVLSALKNLFENDKIIKISNSSKNDMSILAKYNIALKNVFDIDIARYLLFAGMPKQENPKVVEYKSLMEALQKQMKEEKVFDLYQNVEIPLTKVLFEMESSGFKIDPSELDELDKKYKNQLQNLTQKIYELAGEEFNINSPKQVAEILFDKLGLDAWNNKKRSTNVEILEDIKDQHEIVEYIIAHRKVSKLISTYVSVYQDILKNSGDLVHTTFNQTLTATGRLSSSEPNMQNIPTRNEEGKNVRKIFISKFADGEIISADYSQIELRLLANMANEEGMIEAFNSGIDIHTKTASEIFGVNVDAVTSAQRRDAKAVNFGIVYGISDFGLSQNIKSSVAVAKNYIESYFDRYPKIKTFMDANIDYAKQNGLVRSYFGRIRHIPEIKASNFMTRKFGERVAMNMPLQGTASDIIKIAMVKLFYKLQGMKSHLILQIHDELIVDASPDEAEQVKVILKECMESVCDFAVPLTVSVSGGKNLFECK